MELNTLTLGNYFQEVGKLCAEKQIDVLFRGYPLEQEVDFPLERQVVVIPDIQHEYFPEFFDKDTLRSRRLAVRDDGRREFHHARHGALDGTLGG